MKTMFYGSGTDKRRAEFRDSVTIKTKTVDASPFVSMEPAVAKSREKDWGFGVSKFPINGRVWYPAGDGPFPLVLIVHGNHDPLDYSDPGYGYLGELLASRGFILVSVDENFINGGLRGESDGRAWMLLKHLEVWKRWNDSTGGPFYHKVDMNNIGIMGHSRGGEAVGIAAAFNRLSHYPDDANVKFNFNFNIKAVFAIAPVDGQYKPAGVFTPIENVNYMVIHGSHDGDVSSFNGLRAYQRIRFTDGKAVVQDRVVRLPRKSRPVEHGLGQQGQRSAQRPIPRPSRVDHPGGAAAVQQGDDRRVHGSDAPREDGVSPDVPRPSRGGRVAAEDDVHHALSGERIQAARDVRRGRRRHHGLGAWRDDHAATVWRRGRRIRSSLRTGNDPLNTQAVTLGWNNHIRGDDTTKLGKTGVVHDLAQRLADVGALPSAASRRSISRSHRPTPSQARALRRATRRRRPTARRRTTRRSHRRRSPMPSRRRTRLRSISPSRSSTPPATRRGYRSRSSACRAGRSKFTFCGGRTRSSSAIPTQFELVLQTYVMPLADFAQASPEFDPHASPIDSTRVRPSRGWNGRRRRHRDLGTAGRFVGAATP